MKILGWMHSKFWQNSSEPLLSAFAIGQPSMDDQPFNWKQNGLKTVCQNYKEYNLRKSLADLDPTREEEEDSEEDQLTLYSNLFHGFLAIGTPGGNPTMHKASTPKFSISIENITEKENDVTEIELMLFSDELERVLGAEAKEAVRDDSLRRNSYVSTGRTSHGSIIILSEKSVEGTKTNGNVSTNCPLQENLFSRLGIEAAETTMVKREDRTSLGELFQRTKLEDENYSAKYDRKDKSAVRINKKILRKKIQLASKTTAGAVDSASSETKLHKIMNMFHRKVHPDAQSPYENERKNKISYDAQYINGEQTLSDEENTLIPQRDMSKRNIQCYKSQSNRTQFNLTRCDSNENMEHWIKTDLNYLVLEL